ncbi:CNOT6L [Cordylochernes scorpioides]|uniref:CNOT6L n=1 Tax=Cordylochernes scorpioides TaxID=51811 RepID=A0ABY6LRQ2_9ARAC|nr:CNOT6L [Cordylochernes scorpioides]
MTFMEDGGLPHISCGVKQLLKDTFSENRVISRHFIHQWPTRSPDLTPCDFGLWGYIKSCVYRCWPITLVMLKASIRRHISSISTNMLFNAVQAVIHRLQAVFENEGRKFSKDCDLIQERRRLPRGLKNFKVAILNLIMNHMENRPQKFEDAELQALLDEDSTQMQEKVAKQLQVSQGAVSLRLNSLEMTQKLSRWVPHELSERQQ